LEIDMSIRKQLRRIAAIGVMGMLTAGSASAQLVTSNAAPGNFIFAGFEPLPGMTTAMFFNNANQRFVVTFSAECAVNAAANNFVATTDIDIVVLDGGVPVQVLAPTDGIADAFCTANGTAGFDGWTRNSVTAVGGLGLAAGFYQVRVRARTNAGAFQAWYGDRSLVVTR
jgi:hypothetical protein